MITLIGNSTWEGAVSVTPPQGKNAEQKFVAANAISEGRITEADISQTSDTAISEQNTANDGESSKLGHGSTGFITQQDAEAELMKLAREMKAQKQQETADNISDKPQSTKGSTSNCHSNIDTIFDEKDTNKDSVVSFIEELKFSISHPSE